jgi:hypothetical protein
MKIIRIAWMFRESLYPEIRISWIVIRLVLTGNPNNKDSARNLGIRIFKYSLLARHRFQFHTEIQVFRIS